MTSLRKLTPAQISALEGNGCTAADWATIKVAPTFDASRVHRVAFSGIVEIGDLSGSVSLHGGAELPNGLYDATIADTSIGNRVRIAHVTGHLANLAIADDVVIANVGIVATNANATFGNGVALETVNEGGGRDVRLFNEISSQFAYLLAMHRYRGKLVERMDAIVASYVAGVKSDKAAIGEGARILNVGEMVDVAVGPHAVVDGAIRLHNGTILSEKAAPAKVGAGVVAEDFIVAEGASVDSGAILSKVFVGQATKVGKTFSGENSLFFANCECFHSEAVSIFAGPYTVTHHRSSLLIAGVFSFYNAGSGTNQSNHMYKLGPVHQGALERGSKTGSFSYMMWPCVVSPFSVVIGKNMVNFDSTEFPFSYITAEEDGTYLTPAMNMFTVGTARDGAKWPARDRRKATVKRDQIRFEVFSPYVLGRMLAGEAAMTKLNEATDKSVKVVRHKGLSIKRLLLRNSAKNYALGIDLTLNERILARVGDTEAKGIAAVRAAMAADKDAVYSREWFDISGLLVARDRLAKIEAGIESGKIDSVAKFNAAIKEAHDSYPKDEWAWVRAIYQERTGKSLDAITLEEVAEIRAAYAKQRSSFIQRILADAEKEFDEGSRLGFGADGSVEDRDAEFKAIRGEFSTNSFVKKLKEELDKLSAVAVAP